MTAPSLAIQPAGSEFRVNTYTTSEQRDASVAMDRDGNFVVTWTSRNQDGSIDGVYAQRYSAAGVALGTEFRVNTYTEGLQQSSAVAMDTDGDFVVTWSTSAHYGYTGDDIWAQRYNAEGIPQGGEFKVNSITYGGHHFPAVAMDDDGDFVVTWMEQSQDGDSWGIFARRYSAAGVPQGTQFRVNTYTTGAQYNPAVATDADGNFLVVWWSSNQDGGSAGIYAQRFNTAGVAQGSEFLVNSYTTGNQENPAIAMNGDGNFIVAWESVGQDGDSSGIFARRYNAAGIAQGSDFRVNSVTTGDQYVPAVAMDADGDFVLAWSSHHDGDFVGVFAQRYNAGGGTRGSEFRVNTTTTDPQWYPAVAMDSAGDFVVSWESWFSEYGIYAQRYVTENLTSSLQATATGQSYTSSPSPPEFLSGGTFSFNASYCNTSANTLSGLYSLVTVLSNNNVQANRDRDAPAPADPAGGPGAQMDIDPQGGYTDLLLSNAECVQVPYQIGLTARAPFQFRVNIRGDSSS